MEEIIFPNQIRMIRRTRGKTMKEIASVLNISLSAVSKIEKGYRRVDDDQLEKISAFLNCPKESIFVYKKTAQPEVVKAWAMEQERRKQINEKSGLKTLGAGLRYLRGDKMLTLQQVAEGAGLTLSVYHRIEMGQREVTEEQFGRIAHALGYAPEDLQLKIYELDMAGTLQEFKKSGEAGIFHPKGGYNDLPLRVFTFAPDHKTALFDGANANKKPVEVTLPSPDLTNCFAVEMQDVVGGVPIKVLVEKEGIACENELALYKKEEVFVLGTAVKEGDAYFIKPLSGKEKILVGKEDLKKVVAILV